MHLLESPMLEQSEPAFLLSCMHQDALSVLKADHKHLAVPLLRYIKILCLQIIAAQGQI